MRFFREYAAGFALCIVELIAGILLLLDPLRSTSIVISNPFACTEILWLFTGATLVGAGIFALAVLILCRKAKGADTL